MQRQEIIELCEQEVLGSLSPLYDFDRETAVAIPGSEGCQNIVYEYQRRDGPAILRISYRSDRPTAQIQGELDFIAHLASNGVRVSTPIHSSMDRAIETMDVCGQPLNIVSFTKGKGMRVPDNGYKYRTDAPIEEYFQNWGRTLGRMHALTKSFLPARRSLRPDWFEAKQPDFEAVRTFEDRLPKVFDRIHETLQEISSLPKDDESYGLIHADFNDGNFTVDYSNGDITAFDFDDCCHFWFIYELASAWESGIGRIMRGGQDQRKAFMDHYFSQVLTGYASENSLPDSWLARLPLFLKLVQIEEFIYFVKYFDQPNSDALPGLRYKIRCLEEDIPYLGFFDPIYSPERPFEL